MNAYIKITGDIEMDMTVAVLEGDKDELAYRVVEAVSDYFKKEYQRSFKKNSVPATSNEHMNFNHSGGFRVKKDYINLQEDAQLTVEWEQTCQIVDKK